MDPRLLRPPACQSWVGRSEQQHEPECAHVWSPQSATAVEAAVVVVRDVHGNVLQDGDTVIVIKDLKVKGASSVVKVGIRVRVLRLVEGDHNIDCRIEGIGQMGLKSEFVKKV